MAAAVEKLRAASKPAKPAAKMPVEQKAATKMPAHRPVVSKIPVVERLAKTAIASIPRVTGGGETGLGLRSGSSLDGVVVCHGFMLFLCLYQLFHETLFIDEKYRRTGNKDLKMVVVGHACYCFTIRSFL